MRIHHTRGQLSEADRNRLAKAQMKRLTEEGIDPFHMKMNCAGVAEDIDVGDLTKQELDQGRVDFCASLLLDGKWLKQPVMLPGVAEPVMIIRQALDYPKHPTIVCYCDVLFPKGFRLKEAHTYTQPDISYMIADAKGDTWEQAFALALRRANKLLAPILARCQR